MSLALKLGRLEMGTFVGGVVRGLLVFETLALAIVSSVHAIFRKEWTILRTSARKLPTRPLRPFLRKLQRPIRPQVAAARITSILTFCASCQKQPTVYCRNSCHPHSIRSLCDRQSKLLIPHNRSEERRVGKEC